MKKRFEKKIFATFIFSVITSLIMIAHGIFFDLDFSQIKRLSIEGFLLTFVLVFTGLIILERIFNIEEDIEIIKIKERLRRIERRLKR